MKFPKLPDGPHPVGEAKVRFMQTLDAPYLSASAPGWSAAKSGDFSRVTVDEGEPVQPPHELPDGWYSNSAPPMVRIKGSSHPRKRFRERGGLFVGDWGAYGLLASGRGWAWGISHDRNVYFRLHKLYRGGLISKPIENGVFASLTSATDAEVAINVSLTRQSFMYFGQPALLLTTYHPNGSGMFKGVEIDPYKHGCYAPAVTVVYISNGAAQYLELTLPTKQNWLYSWARAIVLSPTRILVWYSEADVTTGNFPEYLGPNRIGISSYRVGPPKAFLFTLLPDGNVLRRPVNLAALYPNISNEWARDTYWNVTKENVHTPLSLYRFTDIQPLTARRVLVHTTYLAGSKTVVKEFVFDVTTGEATEVADLTAWLKDESRNPFRLHPSSSAVPFAKIPLDRIPVEYLIYHSALDSVSNPFGAVFGWEQTHNYGRATLYHSDYPWTLVLGEGSWLRTKYLTGEGFKVTGYGASEEAVTWRSDNCVVVGCRTQANPNGYRIYYVARPPGIFIAEKEQGDYPGTAQRVLYEASDDLTKIKKLHSLTEAAQKRGDYTSVTWVGSPQSPAPCDPNLPFRTDARFTMPDWYKDGLDL